MAKNLSVLMLDGESNLALSVARCLAQIPNLKLHVLSKTSWVPTYFSRHRSSFCVQQIGDNDEQQLEVICHAIKRTHATVLLPLTEPSIRFVSAHRAALTNLVIIPPTPEIGPFDIVDNKWLLADFLARNDIPNPRTVLYTADETFEKNLSELSFPVLLKPTRGSSGANIQYFDNPATLLDFLQKNKQFLRHRYIVQNFVRGYDIDCSFLCHDGTILAYTIQKGFIPGLRRFAPPVGIEFVKNQQTLDVVTGLVSHLRWSGVAHVDLRYDEQDKQVKLIEVNPRYWDSLLGSLFVGINFPYLACLSGLGVSFSRPDYQLKRYVPLKVALKQWVKRYLGKSKAGFAFREISWKYDLADPLPGVMNILKKGLQALNRNTQ